MLNLLKAKPVDLKGGEIVLPHFMMGADPEFLRIRRDTGESAPAYQAFSRCTCGNTWSCRCTRGRLDTPVGEMGLDGHDYIFEARPKPSISPWGLAANMGTILTLSSEADPDFAIVSAPAAQERCCGGHVHFGAIPAPYDEADYRFLFSGSVGQRHCIWCDCREDMILVGMDDRVVSMSRALAPLLAFLEGVEGWNRRWGQNTNGRYGRYDDYRENDHGFEYRTPGSWCGTPIRTLTTLSLIRGAFKLSQDPEWVDKNIHLYLEGYSTADMYRRLVGEDTESGWQRRQNLTKTIVDNLWLPYWNRLNGAELLALSYVVARNRKKCAWKTSETQVHNTWNNYPATIKAWLAGASRLDALMVQAAGELKVRIHSDSLRDMKMGGLLQ